MLYTLLLLALSSSSLGADVTLSSADDFTKLVDEVNSGNNYSGTTVYLGSDITLLESVDPIGINSTYYFSGAFDGQGHIISNLTMNTSLRYTGLFGCSEGLIIRNVVLDDSCSIKNSFSGSDSAYVGGVIGYCYAEYEECNIENSVNMADVTFNGSISESNNLLMGGVIGYLSSSSYDAYVKNCVNYGSVTDSGTVGVYAELGGIVGYSDGTSLLYIYIQNCLNYGAITHNGVTANFVIGGILSNCYNYTYIENCVSAGKIYTQTTAEKDNDIGSIVGNIYSNVYINYCYYTSDVNVSGIYGHASYTSSITGTPDTPTGVGSDLVSKLNSNATSCNWNKWLLNANNVTVTFKMGDDKEVSFSSQIILPPRTSEGREYLPVLVQGC